MKVGDYPAFNEEVVAILKQRYSFDINDVLPEDTNQLLAERIKVEAKSLGKKIINQIPSQFDYQNLDLVDAVPQYQFPTWRTLDDNLDFFGIKGGALWTAPAIWQYAWPFHRMCRKHKLFAAYGDIHNIPLCVEIIRQAKISCFVAPENIALALHKEMLDTKTTNTIHLAVIIKDVRSVNNNSDYFQITGATTLWEIQLFPGHTIAYQSFGLVGNNNTFHLSDDYLWRFEKDATYITGIKPEVLPVFNYRLPVVIKPVESKTQLPAFAIYNE